MACVAIATFAVLATVTPSAANDKASLILAPDQPAGTRSELGTQLWPTNPCPGGDCPEPKGGWLT
jgi:hypothetical protein